jgi:predicted RNA-binding protein with PIN domain
MSPGEPRGAPSGKPDWARRTPLALPGGVFDDSVEAAEHLLGVTGGRLVVDGYNVTMEGWPDLGASEQRVRLLTALSDLAHRFAVVADVVFDGAAVETLPLPAPARRLVRVRFSPAGVEADDVVIDLVSRIPAATPVIVVSSDKRVRDGARRAGANLLHARQLLALLRR